MNRIFFALAPSDTERSAAAQARKEIAIRLAPCGPAVTPENYHVTLIVLDNLTPAQQAAAILAARSVALDPFTMTFDIASCFRNKDVPWWLGQRQTSAAALELRNALHQALWGSDVPVPKRTTFQPHITIQRHERIELAPTPITPFSWNVVDFVLMRSQHPEPYAVIERFKLGGRKAEEPADRPPDQLALL